jgi:hypothetical protein
MITSLRNNYLNRVLCELYIFELARNGEIHSVVFEKGSGADLRYDEKNLRYKISPDFGSSHASPTVLGLKTVGSTSSTPIFLKDPVFLGRYGSREQ